MNRRRDFNRKERNVILFVIYIKDHYERQRQPHFRRLHGFSRARRPSLSASRSWRRRRRLRRRIAPPCENPTALAYGPCFLTNFTTYLNAFTRSSSLPFPSISSLLISSTHENQGPKNIPSVSSSDASLECFVPLIRCIY